MEVDKEGVEGIGGGDATGATEGEDAVTEDEETETGGGAFGVTVSVGINADFSVGKIGAGADIETLVLAGLGTTGTSLLLKQTSQTL